MRDLTEPDIDKYRIEIPPDTQKMMAGSIGLDPRRNGAFVIPHGVSSVLRVIAAAGAGWDHVSVSTSTRCPTWEEMSFIHHKFFHDGETAMQLHVPSTSHINIHPFVLHMWRPRSKLKPIPMPPKSMV